MISSDLASLRRVGPGRCCLDGMLPGETQDAQGNGAGDSVNAALPSESDEEQNTQL